MKKRILTGLVIFAALIVFFLLKIYVQVEVFERKLGGLFFDAFIMFMAVAGAYEMTRAFKEKMVKAQRILAVVFPLGIFPLTSIPIFTPRLPLKRRRPSKHTGSP